MRVASSASQNPKNEETPCSAGRNRQLEPEEVSESGTELAAAASPRKEASCHVDTYNKMG